MHGHHPVTEPRFAMQVNGHDDICVTTGWDLVAEGIGWKLPRRRAFRVVTKTLDRLEAALSEIDRAAHPGVSAAAWRSAEKRTAAIRGSLQPSPDAAGLR
jgi:serine/threonine-protein kinase HipA